MKPETKPCSSCGAPVIWAETEHKRMPVDAEPVEGGNVTLFLSTDGRVLATVGNGVQWDLFAEELEGRYVSHFATCPDADRWRRK